MIRPLKLVLDLNGQLARRRENQDAGARRCRADIRPNIRDICGAGFQASLAGIRHEPMHDRQQKRQCLARAGLRASDQVCAIEQTRIHGALDRRRQDEPAIDDGPLQARMQAKRREFHRRSVVGSRLEGQRRGGDGDRPARRWMPLSARAMAPGCTALGNSQRVRKMQNGLAVLRIKLLSLGPYCLTNAKNPPIGLK